MNPSKLSGVCGRLKCCLAFEKLFYISELEKYPEIEQPIETPLGKGLVDKIDIFHGIIYVRYPNDDLERFTLAELKEYEDEILYPLASQQIEIDLDDGVEVNYAKFGEALKKI